MEFRLLTRRGSRSWRWGRLRCWRWRGGRVRRSVDHFVFGGSWLLGGWGCRGRVACFVGGVLGSRGSFTGLGGGAFSGGFAFRVRSGRSGLVRFLRSVLGLLD